METVDCRKLLYVKTEYEFWNTVSITDDTPMDLSAYGIAWHSIDLSICEAINNPLRLVMSIGAALYNRYERDYWLEGLAGKDNISDEIDCFIHHMEVFLCDFFVYHLSDNDKLHFIALIGMAQDETPDEALGEHLHVAKTLCLKAVDCFIDNSNYTYHEYQHVVESFKSDKNNLASVLLMAIKNGYAIAKQTYSEPMWRKHLYVSSTVMKMEEIADEDDMIDVRIFPNGNVNVGLWKL